jgi:ABC-type branched-subunit amino acid transport system substrate-binding protein
MLGITFVFVLADAIERAGSLDRAKIREALVSTKLFTPLGTYVFDAQNGWDAKYCPLWLVQSFPDTWYIVYPKTADSARIAEKDYVYPLPG